MPVRALVEEFENRKNDGGFDDQIYNSINLTVKLADKDIEDIDYEASKERARKVFNVTFFEHLKRRYPAHF